jgi:MFS family permease
MFRLTATTAAILPRSSFVSTTADVSPAAIIVDTTVGRGRRLVPVLAYVGLLVAIVSSLGAPLIPTIATEYHVSLGTAQWSLTITLLVGAVATPTIGRLADGRRRRHVLIGALGVMATGSVLAALPVHVFAILLVGRGMQGAGLSLLPLAMTVARDHLPVEKARPTLANLSLTALVGAGLGYPLTGILADAFDLHAPFWMAAALAGLAMIASIVTVPGSEHRPKTSFDVIGALSLGTGLGLLLLCISQGETWGWSAERTLGCGLAGLVIIGSWIWHELRVERPLIELRMMTHRRVLTANITGIIAGMGMYMYLAMAIRYVQTPKSISYGLGESVLTASCVLLPLTLAGLFSTRVTALIARHLGADSILPIGALGFAAALLLFVTARSQLWEMFVSMGIVGLSMGCTFAVMPRMIALAVPSTETGSALALNQVLRSVGYSIGSAVAATILTAHTPEGIRFPTNHGYTVGALLAVALCLVAAVISWLLPGRERIPPTGPLSAEEKLAAEESVDGAATGVIIYRPDPEPRASIADTGVEHRHR